MIKKILLLFNEIFFLVVACIIFPILFVIGIIYTFLKHLVHFDYSISAQFTPIIRSITLLIDGFANAGCGELLNDVFKIKGVIRYGKWYQTISAVTGLIFLYVKDTRLRKILDRILGTDHCVDAISKEDMFFYSKNIK